ncbi:hypothetical protein FRC06_004340 [Ceratobasidium sp. 370]|nr:hypothetical protein FRC06_004340 [Ceratobasidium sp. 370]
MTAKIDDATSTIEETHLPGTSRYCPDAEDTYLAEEYLFHEPNKLFGRVLSAFEFSINGVPTVIDASSIPEDGSGDLEVVGIVGTIYNKEGLFAQCGWFGNHDLDWFWARIRGIRQISVRQDKRFRCA